MLTYLPSFGPWFICWSQGDTWVDDHHVTEDIGFYWWSYSWPLPSPTFIRTVRIIFFAHGRNLSPCRIRLIRPTSLSLWRQLQLKKWGPLIPNLSKVLLRRSYERSLTYILTYWKTATPTTKSKAFLKHSPALKMALKKQTAASHPQGLIQ